MTNRQTPSTRSKKKTNSRRSGKQRPDRTAHQPLRAHTLDHFRRWASLCILDNGRHWELETFQLEILEHVFLGYREVLAVLPTGSYKTTTAAGLGIYHCQFTPSASVPIGAAATNQARIMYRQAKEFVNRTPGLKKRFKVQDGYKRITCLSTGGMMEVYSAKDDTGDGIIPSLAFLDELHRHKGHDLYGTWRDKLTKRDGQMVTLSTAGDDEANPVEEMRDAAHKLPNIVRPRGQRKTIATSDDKGFAMIEYALHRRDDVDDLAKVKLANPAKQVTLAELAMRRDSPSTKSWQWRRFTCNLRTKGGEDSGIEEEEWDSLSEDGEGEAYFESTRRIEIATGTPVYGWLDLGWKIDTTALGVIAWESSERRVITDVSVLTPPVDEADIVVGLLRLQARYGPRVLKDGEPAFQGVVFDPNAGGTQMAQQLEKGTHLLQLDDDAREQAGLPRLNGELLPPIEFIEHSQDNAPMGLASRLLDEAVRSKWIVQDGHPTLKRHVLNAVSKSLGGEKWRYDRPSNKLGEGRRKFPIDCLTGVLMGHRTALGNQEEAGPEPTDYLDYQIGFV